MFQLFSVLLWSFDDYIYYAGCVVFLTIMTICAALYTTRKVNSISYLYLFLILCCLIIPKKFQQTESLRDLVKKSSVKTVTVVRRNGVIEEVDSWKLVPGDIIEIPVLGCRMACDALVLNGNCIVNESTLTGKTF